MHSWIGSFNQKIADPIRSDPGVSDMDLDPIQIHKNRIFDPDRGSFRSDHYTTVQNHYYFIQKVLKCFYIKCDLLEWQLRANAE